MVFQHRICQKWDQIYHWFFIQHQRRGIITCNWYVLIYLKRNNLLQWESLYKRLVPYKLRQRKKNYFLTTFPLEICLLKIVFIKEWRNFYVQLCLQQSIHFFFFWPIHLRFVLITFSTLFRGKNFYIRKLLSSIAVN